MYSCPYSDTISLSAVIWIFVLYPFASWLVGVVVVIYMFFQGSIVTYYDLTNHDIKSTTLRVYFDMRVVFGGHLRIVSMRSLAGIANSV